MISANRTSIKVSLSVTLLLISIVAMLQSIDQSRVSSSTVEHTYTLLNLSKSIQSTSFDYENTVNEYLVARQQNQLKQLNLSRENILNSLFKMQTLTVNNPNQQLQLNAVRRAFLAVVNEFDNMPPNKGGLVIVGPTIGIMTKGAIVDLNTTMLTLLHAFDLSLQTQSKEQQNNATHKSFIAEMVMLTSLITGTGVLLMTLMALRREVYQREKAEERWKFALEGSGEGVCDWNLETGNTYYSKRWVNILGLSQYEIGNTRDTWEQCIHIEDRLGVSLSVHNCLEGIATTYTKDYRVICKDGHYKWVHERGMVAGRNADGRPLRMISTLMDISMRKKSELELSIAAIAFESQEGMVVTDAKNIILRVNSAFTAITGYTAKEIIGRTPSLLSAGRHDKQFYSLMWTSINQTGFWEGEVWNRRKNGEVYPEKLSITAVKDDDGVVTNYVAALADITKSKAASEEIKNLAFYDPLTLLPNRRLFIDRLNQALTASARSGQQGALLFIDLDHFKTLNDTLGHDMGDLLLQQVASRLTACVREGDTVARLGGDEFVILLENLSEQDIDAAAQTEFIGDKVLATLNQTYQLNTYEYNSTPSIGATLFNSHLTSMEILLKQADIAMYEAKESGRNALRFFDPKMQEVVNKRADLERELRKAIELQQFQLYYQIQVSDDGSFVGAEALIRWIHPIRGMISPLDFIPLAEETGLILPIGQWVIETACAQILRWQQDTTTNQLRLSVNVSAKQFRHENFVAQVKAAVSRYDINPELLKLELTESILLDNIDNTIDKMNELTAIGIHFSLDDFGTGYSSLQYLKKLPLVQLKIDQSFVRDIATDDSDKAIVRTIIAMAHSLDINVIAEGVETEEQRQYLKDNGCMHYQGYLFGKPMPIEALDALIKQAEEEKHHTRNLRLI